MVLPSPSPHAPHAIPDNVPYFDLNLWPTHDFGNLGSPDPLTNFLQYTQRSTIDWAYVLLCLETTASATQRYMHREVALYRLQEENRKKKLRRAAWEHIIGPLRSDEFRREFVERNRIEARKRDRLDREYRRRAREERARNELLGRRGVCD